MSGLDLGTIVEALSLPSETKTQLAFAAQKVSGHTVGRAEDKYVRAALKGGFVDEGDAGRDANLRQIDAILEGFRTDGGAPARDFHDRYGAYTFKRALFDGLDRRRQV